MNINPDEEFEQYLKDPVDPELKAIFEEAESCLQRYDAKSKEVKQLSQQMQDLAFSLDLESVNRKVLLKGDRQLGTP